MSTPVTQEASLPRSAREVAVGLCRRTRWRRRLECPTAVAGGEGWMVTVPFSGAATGRLQVWIEAVSAAASAQRGSAGESDPADDVVARVLASVVSRMAGAGGEHDRKAPV